LWSGDPGIASKRRAQDVSILRNAPKAYNITFETRERGR
jgi:hypothetical protein